MSESENYRNMGQITGQSIYAQGQMAADFANMKEDLHEIKALLGSINARLTTIENRELERKGAVRLAIWSAGIIGAVVSWLASHLVK